MTLVNMGIIKGRPIQTRNSDEPVPHYHIYLNSSGVNFRVTINARSSDGSMVHFLRKDITSNEYTKTLKSEITNDGLRWFSELFDTWRDDKEKEKKDALRRKLAIDYIASGLIERTDIFTEVPYSAEGNNNDINDLINEFIQPTLTHGAARLYIFGQVWGPETKADEYFGFLPGLGIHDIHMNQRNPEGAHYNENGKYQDGCLIQHLPGKKKDDHGKWDAIFIKFNSQLFKLD